METQYKVEDIMTTEVLIVLPDMNISDAAKLMAEKEVGSTIVSKDKEVLGILTEQDLARKVLAKDIDPKQMKVEEIMTKNPITTGPIADIYNAMVLMGDNKIKHLPVVNEDRRLLGIITFKDIIKIQPDLIEILSFKNAEEE